MGGVVGLLLVLGLIGLLFWLLRRKRKNTESKFVDAPSTQDFPREYDNVGSAAYGQGAQFYQDAPLPPSHSSPSYSARDFATVPISSMPSIPPGTAAPTAASAAAAVPVTASAATPSRSAVIPPTSLPTSAGAAAPAPAPYPASHTRGAADNVVGMSGPATRPPRPPRPPRSTADAQQMPAAAPTPGWRRSAAASQTPGAYYEADPDLLTTTYEDTWASADSPYGRAGVGRVTDDDPPPPRAVHMQPGQVYTNVSPLGAFTQM